MVKALNQYLELIVNGICTGLGAAIGTYLAARVFIHHFEMIEKKLKSPGD
jgi:hypothetical protein